jgi:predicted dehydrogenase
VTVLLVGAGRVGQRHLAGLLAAGATVAVVDPQEGARATAVAAGATRAYASLDEALGAEDDLTAAVSAEPAEGRLERLSALLDRVEAVLVEKPLEQSRARTRELVERCAGRSVDCNLNLRLAPVFAELRDAGPYRISVTGGAWGFGCNGIHYIDLALFLAGAGGRLAFAELEQEPIVSPRGTSFRDYGGTAVFVLDDGSRLALDCGATSSAPVFMTVALPDRLVAVDLHADREIDWRRRPGSDAPVYRYGADYDRVEVEGRVARSIPDITEAWLRSVRTGAASPLPPVSAALAAHELLFDLLETTGDTHFPIT